MQTMFTNTERKKILIKEDQRIQMAMTPEPLPGIHSVDFRAPPPSPVGPGRRSSFANDDVLSEYLQQSVKVPDLVLPDRVFPRQNPVQNPPKIDFQKLEENKCGIEVCELIAQVGCFEVINHGISRDLMQLVLFLAGGIFEIASEKKKTVARSPERRYGFEEIVHGEEEIKDQGEDFLWCGDEEMRLEMEGVWPFAFSNFSQEMEKLSGKIDKVGRKVLEFIEKHGLNRFSPENGLAEEEEAAGKVCHIQKHCRKTEVELSENSLRYDVIRMLIKGCEFRHALSLHVWSGSTDFHVYSKKGWASFCPAQGSIVVTVGDKLQEWSGGKYKHVIGRPIFKAEDKKPISMAFLFSPPNVSNSSKDDRAVTISVTQQIIFAVLITAIYQFLFLFTRYFYRGFN